MKSDYELVDEIISNLKSKGVSKSKGYLLLGMSMSQLIHPVENIEPGEEQDFEDNIKDTTDEEADEYENE